MRHVKQVIVIRKDLKMRRGKEVAQGAHASLKVFLDRKTLDCGLNQLAINLWPAAQQWINGQFTKVCVSCDSEEELKQLFQKAEDAGIPASFIVDAGHTEFHGVPTPTAVAIGPWWSDEIDAITGELKLL